MITGSCLEMLLTAACRFYTSALSIHPPAFVTPILSAWMYKAQMNFAVISMLQRQKKKMGKEAFSEEVKVLSRVAFKGRQLAGWCIEGRRKRDWKQDQAIASLKSSLPCRAMTPSRKACLKDQRNKAPIPQPSYPACEQLQRCRTMTSNSFLGKERGRESVLKGILLSYFKTKLSQRWKLPPNSKVDIPITRHSWEECKFTPFDSKWRFRNINQPRCFLELPYTKPKRQPESQIHPSFLSI